jgi:hypothetical protein
MISAGAAGLEVLHGVSVAEEQAQARVVGPSKIPLKLDINGQVHSLSVEPRATLAETLRDELHLTGTKVVCDRGSCSACTVMLDKTPVCSCMTLAVDVGKRKITTIEAWRAARICTRCRRRLSRMMRCSAAFALLAWL